MKNYILIFVIFLSYFPSRFYNLPDELSLSLFYNYPISSYWFLIVYISAIQFVTISYCLYKPKGIDVNLRLSLFIITILDLLHLILYAKQGFQNQKLLIAILIIILVYDSNKYRKANI